MEVTITLFDSMTFQSPVLRVRDKEANINFYRETLGFKLLSEENSLAFFCAQKNVHRRFTLEESPDYRTRIVEGDKKLNKLIFKTSQPREIEALLAQGYPVQQIFKGERGYAFEAVSPQGDVILLHAEDHPACLAPTTDSVFQPLPNFQGLEDYQLETIMLNVADVEKSQAFYQPLPLDVKILAGQGQDLTCQPDQTWDLEILEFSVPKDYKLKELADFFNKQDMPTFLDKKESILVVSDPSNIELWFQQ